ncbi:hypothetical protein BASA50_002480 [Batrachochytrium salamandrivorans]|uniref:J domain-containing protein n=1 Tax=Batrachochytrium salamandrivorans TaxID=1357716 RepID=A0ABQ8FL65_9FUNG|nr:hypothetical protein BASA60_009892 [Batrachochytrium salamandrivorans]KAH6600212.1 hypothetical protein BASA50_002480 [Batrachochytrium salamandrivorans]KAH9250702.1 hypothetical protein BASA81_011485 [Batrachochytrium salamandrivorans]KAH9264109.1 hypothetical protein BASA83_012418 [Batrachochytrium salamandrivorans]
MLCHYVVLDVERTATPDELKKAYRRKALELHPDKNPDRKDEATQLFTQVQSAYEVLSDPHERTWYDSHREAILRNASNSNKDNTPGLNLDVTSTDDLMAYFSSACYTSIDDPSPQGFYAVYNELFVQLAREESEALQSDPDALIDHIYDHDGVSHTETGLFGDINSSYMPLLHSFYIRFANFSSVKSFRWVDIYKITDIPDRRVRRLAEKHNKGLRTAARKEFSDAVRRIAAYLRKRDPRVKIYLDEVENARLCAEAKRKDRQKSARIDYRRKMAESYQEAEWSRRDDPVVAHHDTADEVDCEEDQYLDEFVCVACNKSFRSAKQLENHEKSRKHIDAIAKLRAELIADGFDIDSDEESELELLDDSDIVPLDDSDIVLLDDGDSVPLDDDDDTSDDISGSVSPVEDTQPTDLPSVKTELSHSGDTVIVELDASIGRLNIDSETRDTEVPILSAVSLQQRPDNSDDDTKDIWNTKKGGKGGKGKKKAGAPTKRSVPSHPKPTALKPEPSRHVEPPNAPAVPVSESVSLDEDHSIDTSGVSRSSRWVCHVCAKVFSTRNKMFDHIKTSGHALATPSLSSDGDASANRKKSRRQRG